jgi:hypothetical protein
MVLLWLVDSIRAFVGFELARPLSNGKLVWKCPVPQPIASAVKEVAQAEAHPLKELEEELSHFRGKASEKVEPTTPGVAQTLWSTLLVSGKQANE